MYARVTNFQCDPARLDEMDSIREDIRGHLGGIDGLMSVNAAWNDDGTGTVMAIYESAEAAQAAADSIAELWGKMATVMTAAPEAVGYLHVDNMR